MNSEKSKQAWCMICGKRRPLRDMNHVTALGYTCKKRFKCKLKKPLLEQVEEMRNDPKLKHLFMSQEEMNLYAEITNFREWLINKETKSHYTHEGSYVDVPVIIKELDKRFPFSVSYVERRLDKNKGGR
jgi:predicted house-cleaning noncanonical NTP pyrophosphatase (MazG superfamily)